MFTEYAARNAAPKGKSYKLSDFAGLYLRVTCGHVLIQPEPPTLDTPKSNTVRLDHAAQ
jgi:hypothetical protein